MAKYTRPTFGQKGIETVTVRSLLMPDKPLTVPQIDYPIKPIENFKLAVARDSPVWVPNAALDFQSFFPSDWLEGFKVFPWGSENQDVYFDEFGCQWKYVPSAYGAMLDPAGKPVVDDVTKWEKQVKFPEFKFIENDFMEKSYNPDKVLHLDIFQGATERLVGLLGGYTEAMLALAEEPEACGDFLNAFADWEIAQIDKLYERYPINLLTYHDDFGTERDTFFSERMMEELVLEPTRRIVQHAKNKGAAFEFHSCGNIGRFMKYMIELNVDLLWIQPRANDMPKMKREYGDKIGFFSFYDRNLIPNPTKEQIKEIVRETMETLGKGGGVYAHTFATDPQAAWDYCFELYCYSREYYDKERGEL